MEKIKIGIIGVGHLGAIHLKILHELKEKVEIIGICDTDEAKLSELSKQYNIPSFTNYEELIDAADAVDICTSTEMHHQVGKESLQKGKHTFIEKPICSTVDQAEELIAIADGKKCKFQIGHVERFNTAFESIKHFTKDPLFIECHRLNNFPNRSLDIGVVMDLMIHDIDIILGIVKSQLKDIHAIGVPVLTPLEDIANARIIFENGCVCNLTASRVSDEVVRKIRIFQKETYISLDYVKQEAFIYKRKDNQILKHSLPIEKEQPLQRELAHFVDCILEDTPVIVTGIDGKNALEVAIKVQEQIWKTIKKKSS